MNIDKTLFAQIMDFVPWTRFHRIVQRYGGNAGVRRLSRAVPCHGISLGRQTLDTGRYE